MDPYRLILSVHSYCTSPEYFVVQGRIRIMLLHPTNMLLPGPNVHCFFKFLFQVLGPFYYDTMVVPCHQIVAYIKS